MISRQDAMQRVQQILDGYKKTDRISTGWSVEAARQNGESRTDQQLATTEISRAVRCLYADVETRDDLAAAIAGIAANDHNLPVNRPIHLRDIAALPRMRWQCMSRYPADDPGCPFCGGHEFAWEDGDGSIYSGDGRCKGCGAEVTIRQVDKSAA